MTGKEAEMVEMEETRPFGKLDGVFRLSPRQFQIACDAGAYGDENVELLAGIPFYTTKNPPHEFVVYGLGEILRPIVRPSGSIVREEKSTRLGTWRPIPDIAIVEGPGSKYQAALPGPGDIVLIVEVSYRTYPRDRGPKYRRYAASGIPVYWIVKLDGRLIEVHSDPVGQGQEARYRSCLTYAEGDQVPILGSSFRVGDILPQAQPG